MSRECDKIGGINLGQGICDQPIEPRIRAAVSHAIESGHNQYSLLEGISQLRSRIAEKAASYNRIPCNSDTQVVVTVGSTGAFALASLALLEPGDEVILFTPFYAYHVNLLALCGAVPVHIGLSPPDWAIDFDRLEQAITPRTRMIIVNTPCNPCGKVFSRSELERIGALCKRHDLIAITDEIYEYILFDGHEHVSLASMDGMADRTVTLSGFSKTFSMTGWRLGYAIAPPEIANKMGLLNDLIYICAPTPLQHGVLAAFDLPDSYYKNMAIEYQEKREKITAACRDAGIIPHVPQGAYYFLADISGLGWGDDKAVAARLLTDHGIATVPGSAFYPDPEEGRTMIRICFAKEMAELEDACGRLRALRSNTA
jgi:aminotransferase